MTIQLFIGTKAQYVKLAPIVWQLEERDVAYRVIDSGQHAGFGRTLRPSLDLREPDVTLGGDDDVSTVAEGLAWGTRSAWELLRRRRLRSTVFGDAGGVCVVHGDTLSTLLGALMARRAGLRVAHVEAGLRSGSYLHPFPEEAIRVYVPRLSTLLFPPGPEATANLREMGVRGRVIETSGNTVTEVLRRALGDDPPPLGSGPVLAQLHRQENLRNRGRLKGFLALVRRVAADHPVRFVLHGATAERLERRELLGGLHEAGVETTPLLPRYEDFARLLHSARFVIADGASLQEECAVIGVPTLLWRGRTERPDGLGRNVVLSRYEPEVIEGFLADTEGLRRPPAWPDVRPSEEIVDALVEGF